MRRFSLMIFVVSSLSSFASASSDDLTRMIERQAFETQFINADKKSLLTEEQARAAIALVTQEGWGNGIVKSLVKYMAEILVLQKRFVF